MITISQLAKYVGVTIKAIRHYHQRNLLEEPPRDSSGYRRYSTKHVIDLIKIKTLVNAGVPLSRIKELISADSDQFTAAITEVDRNLQERIANLLRTRERLYYLTQGDRMFASAEVADFLDHLHKLGVSQRMIQVERDNWILLQSILPKESANWIDDKLNALKDPELLAMYLDYDAAYDWSPDDPRLYKLADRIQRWEINRYNRSKNMDKLDRDPIIAQLISTTHGATSPAWNRLKEIAKQLEENR
ncbi:MerR family transcriptional regulator [Paenibacillus lautus]|uniref:MerR family transcriptional regulator n=1 Tax=Paenibacillus lautus TaxID=1401 RepID=UPI001B0EDBD9|nr:MerR family transcriptional regulator [Paenibacillus lautus]GIP00578.1 MerR family transcriptional regulator [Paenibacillus lautus]